ncbi:MAG TPA: HD domain-containing phosphohydrolase, partial [Burkholderiaceae bacterium]|nr:HD domain-containing phosphohydrolase [Burkholderiaceae bacterium]
RCADLLSQLRPQLANPSSASSVDFESALQELEVIPESDASVELVDCLVAIAQFFYLTNIAAKGLHAATRALDYSRAMDDKQLIRRALSVKGVMLNETGNMPGATEMYAEAIKVARMLNDPSIEAPVWVNLGTALLTSAQYSDAIECFVRAETLARSADPKHAAANAATESLALANISNCALHLRDIRRGVRAARRAIELNPDPSTAHDCFIRVIAESTYSRLLLDIGELAHAAEHCESARTYANRFPTARSEYTASVTSGLVDVHSNRADIGLTRLKKALEHARRNVRSEVRDALQACVAGYESAGQPDVALVYLHELLAMNREAKAAQVLMHHSEYVKRVEQPIFGSGSIDVAMANQRGKLRIQLGERELMRNRILLLEQQSVAAELHDDTTGEHCYRVGRLASILGKEIGLEDDVCFLIDLAARLHDIGKLVVPDAILLKPGKLTPGEREIMQTHTTAGADILAKTNIPQMHIAEEIARHHHERWDGNGYPTKLAGTAIPIAARVSALADVFDALTHKRPYKEAWKVSDALAEIASLRGKQFDPELTDIFLELVPRLQREHGDLDEFLAVEAKNSPFIKARKQIAEALKGTDPETTLFEMRR